MARQNVPRKYAAAGVGVGERTLQRWVRRGRDNLEAIDAAIDAELEVLPELDEYGAFLIDLERAEARGRAELFGHVLRQAPTDWHAAAWALPRLDNVQFGNLQRLEGIVRDEDGEEHSAADLLMDKVADLVSRRGGTAVGDGGDEPSG